MSIFISCMAAEGLIEIPPESKVTALPTSASSGPSPSIRIEISFGGCSVPAETASRPPMPRSTISSRSITSTLTASWVAAISSARSAR